MTDTILTTKELSKTYGSLQAVKDVSFSVLRGEIFSLLGPNGAGKTTTISMLSCLLQPTSGTAEIGGHSITNDNLRVREIIGIVPQEIALYDELTARQNLRFWGQMYNLSGKALNNRIAEVLEQVNLHDRADDRVGTYSGGMKRRINIAAGLLHKPQLLFMDEPTVGIDPQSRRRILDMVKELRDQGMTVLYTTHYMEEAQELSDRVGIIDHGAIIAEGTTGELIQMVGEEDQISLRIEGQDAPADLLDRLQTIDGVTDARVHTQDSADETAPQHRDLVIRAKRGRRALPDLIHMATDAGIDISSVAIKEPDLEDVFLHLTGRALRE